MKLIKVTTLLICSLLITAGLWLLLPADLELARKIPALFATISMLSMALAMFLSCRPKWIERFVGGMDRAYIWHKWLGIFGLVGASFHWLLVPGPAGNGIDPTLAEVGEETGQWAMYGLLLLGSMSMVKNIPYRVWYYTHKLMGPIFLISVYRTFFSDVPFKVGTHTGAALIAISIVGCASWLYKMWMKPRNYCDYKVAAVTKLDDALEVSLEPVGQAVAYQAGQFAYLDFGYDKIEHFHPFTIASAPSEEHLTFVIRKLGKHTDELYRRVSIGDKVTVDGAYGQLHKKRCIHKPQIWIAGGIGITPFLSWLKALKESNQPIHLFYVGRGELYTIMIKNINRIIGSNQVTLHTQDQFEGLLNGEKIAKNIENDVKNHQVFACGPEMMMKDIKSQLIELGLPTKQWHNENFSMS